MNHGVSYAMIALLPVSIIDSLCYSVTSVPTFVVVVVVVEDVILSFTRDYPFFILNECLIGSGQVVLAHPSYAPWAGIKWRKIRRLPENLHSFYGMSTLFVAVLLPPRVFMYICLLQ
jgi:hypothetical protein